MIEIATWKLVTGIIFIIGVIISILIYKSDDGGGYLGNAFGCFFGFIVFIVTLLICGAIIITKLFL